MGMKTNWLDSIPVFVQRALLLAAFLAPQVASALRWNVKLGPRFPIVWLAPPATRNSPPAAKPVIHGFVPNEIWIHQNDSIKWTHATDEAPTVTLLYEPQPISPGAAYPAAQQRPSGAVGCSAFGGVTSADDSAYDPSGVAGLKCVNSGALATYGVTYRVNFWLIKFTCLIHANMFELVHVLDSSADPPYTQLRLSWHTPVTIWGT